MKKSSPCGTKTRHTVDREPPLPIYIGLNIHRQTQSKKLISQLYSMGISISYDRVYITLRTKFQLQSVKDLKKMELFHLLPSGRGY